MLLHHDAAIRELEKSNEWLVMIVTVVAAAALVGLGVLLTKII
jgi:hypothetical protein